MECSERLQDLREKSLQDYKSYRISGYRRNSYSLHSIIDPCIRRVATAAKIYLTQEL